MVLRVVNVTARTVTALIVIIIFLAWAGITGADQGSQAPVVVNLIIGAEIDPASSDISPEDKWELEAISITRMLNKIDPLGLNVTIYVTGDYVNEISGNAMYKLYVTSLGSKYNRELAIFGMTTGEEVGPMAYGQQYSRLMEAKRLVESAYICDGRSIEAKGYMPQSFSQSDTTLRILERIGIDYTVGYQAGVIYQPGREEESWPYLIEGYDIYAVPVSTHHLSRELVPLSDRHSKEVLGLSGEEWYDLLVAEFEECGEKDEPMVVIFTNFITGGDEGYMDAFKKFVDHSTSRGGELVSTEGLVNMAKSRGGGS